MLHVSAFLLCTQAGRSDSGWGRCGCEGDGTLAPGLPLEHLGLPSCCARPVSLPAPLSFVCAFSSGPAPPSTPVFLSLHWHPSVPFPWHLLKVPPPSLPSASCGLKPLAGSCATGGAVPRPWRAFCGYRC